MRALSAQISCRGLLARPLDKISRRDLSANSLHEISVQALGRIYVQCKRPFGKISATDLHAMSLNKVSCRRGVLARSLYKSSIRGLLARSLCKGRHGKITQISTQCLCTRWQGRCTRSLSEVSWQDSRRDLLTRDLHKRSLWGSQNIPLTISATKRMNACWLPNFIWWRNPVSKMKSCNGSCSQRARTAYRSVFSLFELSCQTSERHFAGIYVGMPWVTQKKNYSLLLRVMLGLNNLLHGTDVGLKADQLKFKLCA